MCFFFFFLNLVYFEIYNVSSLRILVILFMWKYCDVTCETVKALNSIFQQWNAQAAALWNITGDPCSGSAIDETEFEIPANNPAIKCNCSYGNGTICHITKLYASLSLSLS